MPYPIKDPMNERVSGAEAIALILQQEGVSLAFGYAGTSELALCAAVVSLNTLYRGSPKLYVIELVSKA